MNDCLLAIHLKVFICVFEYTEFDRNSRPITASRTSHCEYNSKMPSNSNIDYYSNITKKTSIMEKN